MRSRVCSGTSSAAWARALGRLVAGEAANGDDLADRFLLPHQGAFNRVPKLARWLLERGLPGAFGYFNARSQSFDEVLLQEARIGLEQLVILGAGFDSRSIRFSEALRNARVFEVDLPEVLAVRAERFAVLDEHRPI